MSSPHRIDRDIQNGIVDFISAICSKFTVIWDKQDSESSQKGTKPTGDYITLNIISGPSETGRASEKDAVDDNDDSILDTFTYKKTFVMTVSIQSFAQNNHLGILQDIIFGIDLPTKLAILQNAGIAIWNIGEPIDISALRNTGFEMRGSLDMDFSYSVEVNDQPGEIQTVDIDGALTSASGTEHDVNINKTIVP